MRNIHLRNLTIIGIGAHNCTERRDKRKEAIDMLFYRTQEEIRRHKEEPDTRQEHMKEFRDKLRDRDDRRKMRSFDIEKIDEFFDDYQKMNHG